MHVCRKNPAIHGFQLPRVAHINVGFYEVVKIQQVSELISELVGCEWDGYRDADMPNGMLDKLMDPRRLTDSGW